MSYSSATIENLFTASQRLDGVSVYSGKVRDCVADHAYWYMVHSDRLSAFDRKIGEVQGKGVMLSAISEFWHQKVTEIVPSAFLARPHPRILKMQRLTPIKLEVIVRGYLTGSLAKAYKRGDREFCGVTLPEGLREYGVLPERLITPTTKGEAGEHDENVSPSQAVQRGLCDATVWQKLETYALKLFELGTQLYAEKGWILVDTKYEFGLDQNGEVVLMDEVHTPDSSRLWNLKTYGESLQKQKSPQAFDKDIVRRYLEREHGFTGDGVIPQVPAEVLKRLQTTYLEMTQTLIPGYMLEQDAEIEAAHFELRH